MGSNAETDPNYWKIIFNRGVDEYHAGDMEKAVVTLQGVAVALKRSHPEDFLDLADCYYLISLCLENIPERKKESLEYALKVVAFRQKQESISVALGDAHFHVGDLYFDFGNYEKALDSTRQSISIRQKVDRGVVALAEAVSMEGTILVSMDRHAESAVALRKAIELYESTKDFHQNLGRVYHNMCMALTQQENGEQNLRNGILYLRKAITVFEAVPEDSDDDRFSGDLADCYSEMVGLLERAGDSDEASKFYNKHRMLIGKRHIRTSSHLERPPKRARTTGEKDGFVFISHTGQDLSSMHFAAHLSESLQQLEIKYFYDTQTILPGDFWKEKIETSVEDCRLFVCILSPKYFQRFWCLKELHLALQSQKKILPVYLEGGPPKVDSNFRKLLLESIGGKASETDLEDWANSVRRLDEIQAIRNYSTAKDAQLEMKTKTVGRILEILRQAD